MQINPYLNFDGNCREAFEFYHRCLGGKIVAMQSHGESPMADQGGQDWNDKIVHARLVVGDAVIMGSDYPPDAHDKPRGFAVSIQVGDPGEAERIFNALAENGKTTMPIQETFWAVRFGMLTDQYGIPWMVNCAKPA